MYLFVNIDNLNIFCKSVNRQIGFWRTLLADMGNATHQFGVVCVAWVTAAQSLAGSDLRARLRRERRIQKGESRTD